MTASGVYTLSQTLNETVQEAAELLQARGSGETLGGEQLGQGKASLNAMLKSLNNQGTHLWTEEEGTLFPEVSRSKYDLRVSSNHFANDWTETTTTESTTAGAVTITVNSITDISNTDVIGIIQNDGNAFWTTVSGAPSGSTVTLAAGITLATDAGAFVRRYTVGTATAPILKPIARVTSVRRDDRTDSNEIPIIFQSRQEYFDLPNKAQTGTIIQAYYSPKDIANETSGIFYFWLTPDSSNPVINFTYERKIQIMVNSTDTLDVPDWAIEAINYNLAVRLIPKFGCSEKRAALLRTEAKTMMEDVLAFDAAVYPIKVKMSRW